MKLWFQSDFSMVKNVWPFLQNHLRKTLTSNIWVKITDAGVLSIYCLLLGNPRPRIVDCIPTMWRTSLVMVFNLLRDCISLQSKTPTDGFRHHKTRTHAEARKQTRKKLTAYEEINKRSYVCAINFTVAKVMWWNLHYRNYRNLVNTFTSSR